MSTDLSAVPEAAAREAKCLVTELARSFPNTSVSRAANDDIMRYLRRWT